MLAPKFLLLSIFFGALSQVRGLVFAGMDPPAGLTCRHGVLEISTTTDTAPRQEISVADVTAKVQAFVTESGLQEGTVTVVSQHTTTAVTINEMETRLVDDLRTWLLNLAPPDTRAATPGTGSYRHNDIEKRPDGAAERQRCIDNGWNIDDPKELEKWRAQEPINAHSHLLAMLIGATLNIGVHKGQLNLGTWQSILFVDLDGPRHRKLAITALGMASD